jgi:hypothetical protein
MLTLGTTAYILFLITGLANRLDTTPSMLGCPLRLIPPPAEESSTEKRGRDDLRLPR